MKTRLVYNDIGDICYLGFENLRHFVKFWEDQLGLIPEEYRDSAKIEFGTADSGQIGSDVSISYERPETAEESKLIETRKQIEMVHDLREFERLRDKLGKGGELKWKY